MNEIQKEITEILPKLSVFSQEQLAMVARAALYGEQAIKRQYGLGDTPDGKRSA